MRSSTGSAKRRACDGAARRPRSARTSDPDHVDHEAAHSWAARELDRGWASCALTQNALVRILSQPKYPNALTVAAAMDVLAALTSDVRHEYWACEPQLTGVGLRPDRLLGHNQIADAYLLGMAVLRDGHFVTFDRRVDPSVVSGAADRLIVLG